MESRLVEPVKVPLEGEAAWFVESQATAAVEAAVAMQAVAVGPGVGQRQETARFVTRVVDET